MGYILPIIFGILFVLIIIIVVVSVVMVNKQESKSETCKVNGDCPLGFQCENGRCKAALGSVCMFSNDCIGGLVCKDNLCMNLNRKEERRLPELVVKNGNDIVVTRKLSMKSLDSYDSERNSDGRRIALAPFDMRSADSTERWESPRVSTPYEEKDGVYICKKKTIADTVEFNLDSSPVVDVCSYSSTVIFLLGNGNTIVEKKDSRRYKAINNVHLRKIVGYNGYLYGLGKNNLYVLSNDSFPHNSWVWSLSKWAPNGILDISASYDSSALWIQGVEKSFLYEGNNIREEESKRRILGRNSSSYIDIIDNTAILSNGTSISGVHDAALSFDGEAVTITLEEKNIFKAIRIVNWKPYLIKN